MIAAPSPNFDARPGRIDCLVFHYTGMADAAAALARLCDPVAKVSSHYLLDEDGTVYALVAEEHRAWHAGVSFWRGADNLNDGSIGIEIVNPGHEWGYRPFPPAQIESVTALCLDILSRHDIPARNIVGHSDVAPDRKQDPGELFPWEALAAAGVGLWPGGADAGSGPGGWHADHVRAGLAAVGYDVGDVSDAGLATLLVAFQRHWRPEAVTGAADAGTVARLERLLGLLAG